MQKRILIGLRSLFKKRSVEQELDKELRLHLEYEIDKNIERGMNPTEARYQAMRSFGGLDQVKEQCRQARGTQIIENLWQDIRYGLRVLVKNPGFSCIAILTLALGIGANTSIFSVIYGALMRPLPYQQGEQLVIIHQQQPLASVENMPFSAQEVFDYRDMNHTLSGVGEHHSMFFILYGKSEPERVATAVVSANFFEVLGVKALVGRTFNPSDDVKGADGVLILSYKYWKESHGGDPNIVGRVFQMNDRPQTVIGVLPPIPQYPIENDVYMPTSSCPARSSDGFITNRATRMMTVFGRLKPGVQIDQARADVATIANHLQEAHPDAYPKGRGYHTVVTPLHEDLTSKARPTFLILLGTAGFVLLLACANVANLMLARLMRREREMAVRTALGAGKWRLVRQLLAETTLLSLAGGLMGLVFASAGMKLLVSFAARFTTRASEIKIDGSILAFTLIVSLLTGTVFGLLPAFTGQKNVLLAIKDGGGRSTDSAARQRIRGLLIVAQVAFSFMLLIGAGLTLRSFFKIQSMNPGFSVDRVMIIGMDPDFMKYSRAANPSQEYRNFFKRVMDGARPLPGVESIAIASNFPFSPDRMTLGPGSSAFELEGHPIEPGAVAPQTDATRITPDFFQTLRIPLIRGRFFNDLDKFSSPGAAIINQTLAEHRWGNEDPTGKRIRFVPQDGRPSNWLTIVGVVGDIREYGLDRQPVDEIYVPLDQYRRNAYMIVRTSGDPSAITGSMRKVIYDAEPQTAITNVQTLERFRDDSLTNPRLTAVLLTLFACLAIIITATGIAGVMALSVSQRTHELGIRMALGASRSSILVMILRQGMSLVIIGLAIGIVGAYFLTALMSRLLFGVTPTDPLTFFGVAVLLSIVAAAAAFVPALKVTNIDPMIALHSE